MAAEVTNAMTNPALRPLHARRATSPIASSASSTSRSTAPPVARRARRRTTRRRSPRSRRRRPPASLRCVVNFAATASDEDDDDLTYSWDFGDGSAASTDQNPSHTYTAAGTYNAKVTVTDGEDEHDRPSVTSTCSVPDEGGDRLPRARLLQDDGLPARLDPGRHRGDQVARHGHTSGSTRPRTRRVFTDAFLAHYDAVVFLSTTGDPLNATQQAAFERYIQGGGGYVGIHAAADTEYDWHLVRQAGGRVLPQPPGRHADRDGPRRRPRSPLHGRPPAPWPRVDEWYNYQAPTVRVGGGGTTTGRGRGCPRPRDGSTSRPTRRTTATRRTTTIRSRGAGATTAAARGTRAWATPRPPSPRRAFRSHLFAGLEVAAGVVKDADCGVRPTSRRR